MRPLLTIIFVCIGLSTFAQGSDKDKAYDLAMEAIQKMDHGQVDEAIELLRKSVKLDPKNYMYPYELGYAYYLKEEFKTSVKEFEKSTKMKKANDQCYQMWGNALDMAGKRQDAIEAYGKGLDKFPNSGRLYFELGNVFAADNINKAFGLWEKGIEVDPTYPSNYFMATKIFLKYTDEEVWGMIYGELFMNIERGSARTEEISKLLYDTYVSEITINSDTSTGVSFSKVATINIDKKGDFKLPFSSFVYGPSLLIGTMGVEEINLNTLDRIRTGFLDHYYRSDFNKEYPNVLFSWQKEIQKAGHLEAYNYWLLSMGDTDEFDAWYNGNVVKYDAFIAWFTENQIKITDKNKFVREY